jgi:hypothetical protein
MTYTLSDHIHNYAVWTAARAVQRNFTETKYIKSAIEQTKLKGLIESRDIYTIEQFDKFHRDTAKILIDYLKNLNDSLFEKATYGRAAKIIAIYIKTAVIIRDPGCILSKIAHPPIDSILLKNLCFKFKGLGLKGITWTRLTENEYFELISKLRSLNPAYFWELEEYWSPIRNE